MYIVGEEEIEALARVIRSGALFRYGKESECDRFEERYAHYLGCKHFALAASGSNALAAAMTAAGLGPGDEVVIPAHTYMATATSVLAVGAIPIIVDIDESLTIDPAAIEAALGTFLLSRTRFGNWAQARGQNEQAARNLGVPVDYVIIVLFMLTSALGAVAGVIQVARFSSVDALRGEGMELQAVAVTVIGGTLLSGGYGSVVGTILGAITFGMIQVGLVLAGAPGHFFKTLTGAIVVGAAILNTTVARRMASSKPLAGFRRSSEAADAAIAAGVTDLAGADPDERMARVGIPGERGP